jgi:hypothetical protein
MDHLGPGVSVEVSVSNTDIGRHDVVMAQGWGLGDPEMSPPGAVGSVVTEIVKLLQLDGDDAIGRLRSVDPIVQRQVEAVRPIVERKLGRKASEAHFSEVAAALPDNAVLSDWNVGSLPRQIVTVFNNWHLAAIQLRALGRSESEIEVELGSPPWRVSNDLLSASGLPYRVNTPEELDLPSSAPRPSFCFTG